MKFRLGHFVAMSFGVALATGCTMVGLDPDAENVRIVDEATAASCEELGKTRVKVLSRIVIAPRNAQLIEEELETLARNAGADLSGNAVVPAGPVEDGTRSYRILRCPSSP